jgi:hypothetical protein
VIFERHAEGILRYAHARLGPDLAEDVTAETFLAAFRHRDLRHHAAGRTALAVRDRGPADRQAPARAGQAADAAPGRTR